MLDFWKMEIDWVCYDDRDREEYPEPTPEVNTGQEVDTATIKRTLGREREQESDPARLSPRKGGSKVTIRTGLIKAMMEKKVNDTQLAKRVGVNRTTIYRIKRGGNTSTEMLESIAKALAVEVNEII